MSAQAVDRATQWIYRGIWGVLVEWFRVPRNPPRMPAGHTEAARTFHPAQGFLSYLKLIFWLILLIVDLALFAIWIAILLAGGLVVALALAPLFLLVMIVPDIIAYVGIHLRYDTTWYVITDRALRLRRGVWTVRESTLTFENIQNVSIHQGPIQRVFRISTLIVETAGGGAASAHGSQGAVASHTGVIEGIADAREIRELIMTRVRASRGAGLGDDLHEHAASGGAWRGEHLAALREIRDRIRSIA